MPSRGADHCTVTGATWDFSMSAMTCSGTSRLISRCREQGTGYCDAPESGRIRGRIVDAILFLAIIHHPISIFINLQAIVRIQNTECQFQSFSASERLVWHSGILAGYYKFTLQGNVLFSEWR